MPVQINARLDEADWERLVEAMPGLSNGERLVPLVRGELASLESRRDLAQALQRVEAMLDPVRQAMRRERLRGKGSEVAEAVTEGVIELAALLLAHTDDMARAPEKNLAGIEAAVVRRWGDVTLQVLRTAVLDPARIKHQQVSLPELQRILGQVRQLSEAAAGPRDSVSSPHANPPQGE